ncbi:hypothetical protein GCM10027051_27780 [Niabella terrae]
MMQLLIKTSLLIFTAAVQLQSCQQKTHNADSLVGLKAVRDTAVIKFFQQNTDSPGHWVASDGALSLSLSNGKVLWMMGDSHIGDYDPETGTIPCLFQARNCLLVQQKDDWSQMQTLTGRPPGNKNFFKISEADSTWFWPSHGFEWKGAAYIYLTELRKKGTGNFGFEATGRHYFAQMDIHTLEVHRYLPLPDFGPVDYVTGFVRDSLDNYIYAYGYSSGFIESNIHLARIDLNNALRWSFWNGSSWSHRGSDAAVITTAASNGTALQRYRDKLVLISTEFSVGCDQGKRIFASTASNPTGPFTERKVVYTIADSLNGHYPFWYTPALHPQYSDDRGLLVTYCINGYADCISACTNGRANPDHYRPRAIRLPYGQLP